MNALNKCNLLKIKQFFIGLAYMNRPHEVKLYKKRMTKLCLHNKKLSILRKL